MYFRKLMICLAIAVAANATPITWTLSNAVFSDEGTATGWFIYDASLETVLSYSIGTSGGNTTTIPAFLFQNGAPNNTGATVYPGNDLIDFRTSFTNGNLNGLELRLAPLAGLTNAGGTVNIDLSNPYQAECYNCFPGRVFVSGQLVGVATVPEPSTAVLALLPLALGAIRLYRRRIAG
jgi:hypothetical protein